MSQMNRLIACLLSLISQMGGSHLTREARERTARAFAAWSHEVGFTHLFTANDIGGKHIRGYVAARMKLAICTRTLQNEMAHLRCMLRAAGCHALANAKEIANSALGLSGASRRGTKTALSAEDYEHARQLACAQGRKGIAAAIRLQRTFGLRANEALHARTDTLTRWLGEIDDGFITVYAGTKGGKLRRVPIIDKVEAKQAISEALEIVVQQDSFLIVRASGKASGGLKQARSVYHGWCHRAGIQPHSARYAYAQELFDWLVGNGYSEREALIAVSLALGHGDGRGRYIRFVYGRRPPKN